MRASKVIEYARALYAARGDEAEAEAAQRARRHEEAGKPDTAANWRAVRAAIREMRGANES